MPPKKVGSRVSFLEILMEMEKKSTQSKFRVMTSDYYELSMKSILNTLIQALTSNVNEQTQ